MSTYEFDVTESQIVAAVGDDVYTIFKKGASTPRVKRIVFGITKNNQEKFKITLFKKDEQRLIRLATLILENISFVSEESQLELTFDIDENGILEVTSLLGTIKILSDINPIKVAIPSALHEDTGIKSSNFVRRMNLRI
jgi:molecular chaperone DnaK (HSP70)